MSKRRWEQIGAAGGIAFVVLQLASQALIQIGGAEPAFTAPAQEIVDFFNNRCSLLACSGPPSVVTKKVLPGCLSLLLVRGWWR